MNEMKLARINIQITNVDGTKQILMTPCILPPYNNILTIEINSKDYYPIKIDLKSSSNNYLKFIQQYHVLFIMKKIQYIHNNWFDLLDILKNNKNNNKYSQRIIDKYNLYKTSNPNYELSLDEFTEFISITNNNNNSSSSINTINNSKYENPKNEEIINKFNNIKLTYSNYQYECPIISLITSKDYYQYITPRNMINMKSINLIFNVYILFFFFFFKYI